MSSHPEATKKLLSADLQKMKDQGEKISMITAYSYPQGLIVDEAGIDIILVGDVMAKAIVAGIKAAKTAYGLPGLAG